MEAAEPLPRGCLDTIQWMVAVPHHLTPCCADVVPRLRWGPPHLYPVVLLYPSTSRFAAPKAPYALDVVCGRTHARQKFILCLYRSRIVYLP